MHTEEILELLKGDAPYEQRVNYIKAALLSSYHKGNKDGQNKIVSKPTLSAFKLAVDFVRDDCQNREDILHGMKNGSIPVNRQEFDSCVSKIRKDNKRYF